MKLLGEASEGLVLFVLVRHPVGVFDARVHLHRLVHLAPHVGVARLALALVVVGSGVRTSTPVSASASSAGSSKSSAILLRLLRVGLGRALVGRGAVVVGGALVGVAHSRGEL